RFQQEHWKALSQKMGVVGIHEKNPMREWVRSWQLKKKESKEEKRRRGAC
ncbi:hypothetical protein AMTR_s00360p00012900, partial [Amborella trichopoda]